MTKPKDLPNIVFPYPCSFDQHQLDANRNATDDFNLWHDPHKWQLITGNPFNGPICLGFQFEGLIEHLFNCYRNQNNESSKVDSFQFSNYEIHFYGSVMPLEKFTVDIRKTIEKEEKLSNRFSIKGEDGRYRFNGFKLETLKPLNLQAHDFSGIPDLSMIKDRAMIDIDGASYFLKRKFLETSDAKNFLVGCGVDQYHYFDELEDRVLFPELFPVALVSAALMEKGLSENCDFIGNPQVYTLHKISVDRNLVKGIKSNTPLHILVTQPIDLSNGKYNEKVYSCFGILQVPGDKLETHTLYRAEIRIADLKDILVEMNSCTSNASNSSQ